ncbi:hypothetical protein Tco_1063050 [Tanacetum coccineum]
MLGLLDMHWSLLHSNDQISLYCFQAFHCDAIMGQINAPRHISATTHFWGCYNDDSEDSDFKCDIEDQINDVHVDMEIFREHTDLSVEWVGPTKHVPEVETNEEVEYEECDLEDFDS